MSFLIIDHLVVLVRVIFVLVQELLPLVAPDVFGIFTLAHSVIARVNSRMIATYRLRLHIETSMGREMSSHLDASFSLAVASRRIRRQRRETKVGVSSHMNNLKSFNLFKILNKIQFHGEERNGFILLGIRLVKKYCSLPLWLLSFFPLLLKGFSLKSIPNGHLY